MTHARTSVVTVTILAAIRPSAASAPTRAAGWDGRLWQTGRGVATWDRTRSDKGGPDFDIESLNRSRN